MKINSTALIFTLLALVALYLARILAPPNYLLVSTKDQGADGIYYALSTDGLNWEPLNDTQPGVVSTTEIGRIGDPFVTRDKDKEKGFHTVFTCSSHPSDIGYAHSGDLISWNNFRNISPFGDSNPGINIRAPGMVYDESENTWIIYWSSTLDDRFSETPGQIELYHRIYAVKTVNFEQFTPRFVFFDPGYPVIDASMLEFRSKKVMLFKDASMWPLRTELNYALSDSIYGPWQVYPHRITATWIEVLSGLVIKDQAFIYYSKYNKPQQINIMRSSDLMKWDDLSGQSSFSVGFSHGSFIQLSRSESARLKKAFQKK